MFQKRYNVVQMILTKAAGSDRPKSTIKAQKKGSWLLPPCLESPLKFDKILKMQC